MAKELLKEQLLAAYDELDELAGIQPPIKWKTQQQFERELWGCVFGDENERVVEKDDKFSAETQSVFDALDEIYGANAQQDEPEQDEPDDEPEEEEPEPVKEKPAAKPKPKPTPKNQPAKKVVEIPKPEPSPEPEEEEEPEPVKEKPVTTSVKMDDIEITDRVDALVAALKMKPESVDDWSKKADAILDMKGGKIKPNNLANKFEIGYFYKLAKHFNLGKLP
jgi:outer membrane biosynthesis protein TonB